MAQAREGVFLEDLAVGQVLHGPSRTVTEADIIAYCKANLASYKAPRKVVFAELPKTSTGKVRKNVLRDQVTGGASGT